MGGECAFFLVSHLCPSADPCPPIGCHRQRQQPSRDCKICPLKPISVDILGAMFKYVVLLILTLSFLLFLIFNPYVPGSFFQGSRDEAIRQQSPDLVITVKTTRGNHKTRVRQIVRSWFQLDPKNVYFVSDVTDTGLNATLGGNLINSHCPVGHSATALACKMNRELRVFVERDAKWSCHFDDDNYVNVPLLKELLLSMDETKAYYLGKASTAEPVSIPDRPMPPFWFGTGGAGVCLSQFAVRKAAPKIMNNGFRNLAARLGLPDDMALGFLMANLLDIELTQISSFYSHFDELNLIPIHELPNQHVLSAYTHPKQDNLVALPYLFAQQDDPFKFRSLHCFIFGQGCPPNAKKVFDRLRTEREEADYLRF
uniref:Fringe glycosyltransferase n=1 Tax=Panagrellus redivivus TaxID=6233 RepID=A0A7E4VQG5_PANRE